MYNKQTRKPHQSLTLGPQHTIPLRFYAAEENPFLKGDGPPANPILNRSRDLVDADKDDEMYEWLGFESREELEKFRAAGLLLEREEEGSETSSVMEDGTGHAKLNVEGTMVNSD